MNRAAFVAIGLGLAGCGAPCASLEEEALAEVLAAVDEDTPCNYDSDCTVVSLVGSCFDGCSDVVHVDDALRYRTAMDAVENDQCTTHEAESCQFAPPPCPAPPENPVCLNNQCLWLPPS